MFPVLCHIHKIGTREQKTEKREAMPGRVPEARSYAWACAPHTNQVCPR